MRREGPSNRPPTDGLPFDRLLVGRVRGGATTRRDAPSASTVRVLKRGSLPYRVACIAVTYSLDCPPPARTCFPGPILRRRAEWSREQRSGLGPWRRSEASGRVRVSLLANVSSFDGIVHSGSTGELFVYVGKRALLFFYVALIAAHTMSLFPKRCGCGATERGDELLGTSCTANAT